MDVGTYLVGASLFAGFGFVDLGMLVVFFVVVTLNAFFAFRASLSVVSIIAYLVKLLQNPHFLGRILDKRRPTPHVSSRVPVDAVFVFVFGTFPQRIFALLHQLISHHYLVALFLRAELLCQLPQPSFG